MRKRKIEFYEVQRKKPHWLSVLLILINILLISSNIIRFYIENQTYNSIEFYISIGGTVFFLFLTIFFLISSLLTYVDGSGIYVRFIPLQRRYKFFAWDDVEKMYFRKFRLFSEFGLGGLTSSLNPDGSYTMSGNIGIQLILKNGRKVFIGTNRPDELRDVLVQLGKIRETENG